MDHDLHRSKAQFCWMQGIERFNHHTKDKRKQLDLESYLSPGSKHCDLSTLAANIQALCEQKACRRGHWLRSLTNAIQTIYRYCPVGDVIVQQQCPEVTFVWGSLRFLIQFVAEEAAFTDELAKTLPVIARSAARYHLEAELFASNEHILDIISDIFGLIVSYLVRARHHLSQPWAKRATKRLISTGPKLVEILREIEIKEADLGRWATAQGLKDITDRFARIDFELGLAPGGEARRTNTVDVTDRRLVPLETTSTTDRSFNLNSAPDRKQSPHQGRGTSNIPPSVRGSMGFVSELVASDRAGCGKTTLARELMLKATFTGHRLFFSFDAKFNTLQAASLQLLASLIAQICCKPEIQKVDGFDAIVERLYQMQANDPARAFHCPELLLECFKSLIQLEPSFLIVVDGLDELLADESDASATQAFVKTIRDIVTQPSTHVVITSRYMREYAPLLEDSVQAEITTSIATTWVTCYIDKQLRRDTKLAKSRQAIIQRVQQDCNGSFIWASLLLERLRSCTKSKVVHLRIASFSSDQQVELAQRLSQQRGFEDSEAVMKRCNMLRILAGARQPMSALTLCALGEYDVDLTKSVTIKRLRYDIFSLCSPFVAGHGTSFTISHSAARDAVYAWFDEEDPDSYLARRCLEVLTNDKHASWRSVAPLLRRHLLPANMYSFPEGNARGAGHDVLGVLDDYAVLHFQDHVKALKQAPPNIIRLLNKFLSGNWFVRWSERLYELKGQRSIAPQVQVLTELRNWTLRLDEGTRQQIQLQNYFTLAHEQLSAELRRESDDKLLPYLPLIRLGQFFNVGGRNQGDWQAAYDYKVQVVAGFEAILGARNPLTLQAKTAMFQEYFWQSRFDEAEKGLRDLFTTQLEVLGDSSPDPWMTLASLGYAQWSLTKYKLALQSLSRAQQHLRDQLGEQSLPVLMCSLYSGYVLERQGYVDEALRNYEHVWETWVKIAGESNTFALMAQSAASQPKRKQGRYSDSSKDALAAWTQRRRIFGDNVNLTADSALSWALVLRDAGSLEDAMQALDAIRGSEVFAIDFERACQLAHIKALVEFDRGAFNQPRKAIEDLVDASVGAERGRNNRSLLWARIDLADAIEGLEQDEHEALYLFREIVEPVETTTSREAHGGGAQPCTERCSSSQELRDEPEPLSQLRLAEQALRLLRDAKVDEAETLLEQNQLRWVRRADFNILQGGPVLDTSIVRPVTNPICPADDD